jgi:hypothetical protein
VFLRSWNDSLGNEDRQGLKPLIPRLVDTNAGTQVEEKRAWMAADWLVRECAPALLRLAGLTHHAEALEGPAARAAAWEAAWRSARDAVRDAAWSAARATTWVAARAAVWAIAGGLARDAARDTAWAAARQAVKDAAKDAACAALEPAVEQLQVSALRLIEGMIEST